MYRFYIWFLVVVLVGGPLTAGFFLGFDAMEQEARRGAESSVAQDAARAEARLPQMSDELLRETSNVAQKAALYQELVPLAAGTGNPITAREKMQTALGEIPADLAVVIDARGAIVLRAKEAGEDLTPSSVDALRGLPHTELVSYRGTLYQIAVAPVVSDARVVGAFALGRRVATLWVERLHGGKNSGVAVVLDRKILGANLAPRERGELERHLGQVAAGKVSSLDLGGQPFFAYRYKLPAPKGAAVVHVRPQLASMPAVEEMRLTYLYAAGGAFALALFIAFLAQRSASRPARLISTRLKGAADTDAPVSTDGLSSAHKRLVGELNEVLKQVRARSQSAIGAAKAEATAAIARASAEATRARAELAAASRPEPIPPLAAHAAEASALRAPAHQEASALRAPAHQEASALRAPAHQEPPAYRAPVATPAPAVVPTPVAIPVQVAIPVPAPAIDLASTRPGLGDGVPQRPSTIPGVGGPTPAPEAAVRAPAPAEAPPVIEKRPQTIPGLGEAAAAAVGANTVPDMPRVSTRPGMSSSAPVEPPPAEPIPSSYAPPPLAPVVPIAKAREEAPPAEPKIIIDLTVEPVPGGGHRTVAVEPEDPLVVLHREFLAARRRCAESTDDVTFDRFAVRVRRLRDQIRARHRCEDVRFDVFLREGRASLRATPRASV